MIDSNSELGPRIDVPQTEGASADLLKPPTIVEQRRFTGYDRFIYYSVALPLAVICAVGGKHVLDNLEQAKESIAQNPQLFQNTILPYESMIGLGLAEITAGSIFIAGAALDLAGVIHRAYHHLRPQR